MPKNFKKEITCPYCSYEHSDSWEYESEDDEIECQACGKDFTYSKDIEVTYCSQKIPCKDGHDFKVTYSHIKRKDWNFRDTSTHNILVVPREELRWLIKAGCTYCDEEVYSDNTVEVTEEQFDVIHSKGEPKATCHITEYTRELFKIGHS